MLLRAWRAPGGSCPSRISEVAGLISKTIQYTYGVIGASESSMIRARLFVPGGAPAQPRGGLISLPSAPQVYVTGIVFWMNALLFTVISAGACTPAPEPNTPQPAIGSVAPIAMATAAARRGSHGACASRADRARPMRFT